MRTEDQMIQLETSQRRKRGQGGNSLMEFALAGGVLFLLTFGVVDFARLFHTGNVVASAGVGWHSVWCS